MKTKFSVVLAVVLMASAGFAAVAGYDTFNYEPGQIGGSTAPALGFSGAWTSGGGGITQCSVEASSLMYAGLDSAYQDDSGMLQVLIPVWDGSRIGRFLNTDPNGPFADYVNAYGTVGKPGQSIYISFLMRTNFETPFYAFELKRNDIGDGGAILYIGNDVGGTNLQVCAFRNKDTSVNNLGKQFNWLGAATKNVELFVVRIDFKSSGDDVTVYRNPALGAEPTKTPDLVNAGFLDFNGISCAAWVDPAGRVAQFDEIVLATSYADAVRFYATDAKASTPSPADGAVDITGGATVNLSWTAGTGVTPASYDVYLSSDLNLVAGEDATALIGTVTSPAITTPVLNTDTVYYWSVKQDDASGVIWSFETNKTYPIITQQPARVMAFVGDEASFEVVSTSNTDQSFQWFNAAGAITNATASVYTIPAVQIADENSYYCEITNTAGTVTSATARLIVKREVGHWSFNMTDNDPNTAFVDSSASANTLGMAGSHPADPSFVDGVDGGANGAIVFDGNYYLTTAREDGLMPNIPVGDDQFTMSLWIKGEKNDCGVFGWGNYGNTNACTAINLNWDAYNGWFRNYWWGGDLHVNAGGSLTDNAWHQIVVTYDGDIRRIYADGLLRGSDNPAPHAVQTTENFTIGTTYLNDPKFAGAIDEVTVYNYFLDEMEVALDYTAYMNTDVCVYPPVNDLDNDCQVTISDFSLIAAEWLDCGLVPACQE